MYFPYLFARRSELLALRDVSAEFSLADTVVPVLEPVKSNPTDLKRCLQTLGVNGVQAIAILNPQQGDFREVDLGDFQAAIEEEFNEYPSLLPGFVCRQGVGMRQINSFLRRYANRQVSILYRGPQLTDREVFDLAAREQVRFHIDLNGQMAATQRTLIPAAKAVDIRDRFISLARNADYTGVEFFTDGHLTFRADAVGYGDYAVIGAIFREGGGPAHAVAIHATFKQPRSNQIWVEHFVSDDVEREVGSVAEKFLQAARKLVRAATRRRIEFGTNRALTAYANYVRTNTFPGLAESKRLQISHHIAVNYQILAGDL